MADRIDAGFLRNQSGRHEVVTPVPDREANSHPATSFQKSQDNSFVRARIAKEAVAHADEAISWDNFDECFQIKRISHQKAYGLDGAGADMAEEYVSRLRRPEIGFDNHIAGARLLRYARRSSWHEDDARVSNGDEVNRMPRRRSAVRPVREPIDFPRVANPWARSRPNPDRS
ncbi:transposase [Bradyrhizobium sp. CCBAU 51753]|uniref:transposase n=1 Tax=Bradyrhizobium sp. CCBAU 51753 TaxID=1325100 RepID=UPI00188C5A8D|nr:transposase [Bradyrhizobium sp. CCBAU 51753]